MRGLGWNGIAALAALGLASAGCASGGQVVEETEAAESDEGASSSGGGGESGQSAREADPLANFGGPRKKAGEPFQLKGKMVGVPGPGVLIRLSKVDWQVIGSPGGGEEDKTGTAVFFVRRGDETATPSIRDGKTEEVLGARIAVKKVGERYDEGELDYLPYAEVVVTPADGGGSGSGAGSGSGSGSGSGGGSSSTGGGP